MFKGGIDRHGPYGGEKQFLLVISREICRNHQIEKIFESNISKVYEMFKHFYI